MKQVQDIKNAASSSVFENTKGNISTDFNIMSTHQSKKVSMIKKMRIKIT